MKRSDAKKILKGKKKLISLVRSMSSGKKGVITISWELNGAAYSLNKLCLKNYNCIPLKLISKLHIVTSSLTYNNIWNFATIYFFSFGNPFVLNYV